jgi:hypothetical protein
MSSGDNESIMEDERLIIHGEEEIDSYDDAKEK